MSKQKLSFLENLQSIYT